MNLDINNLGRRVDIRRLGRVNLPSFGAASPSLAVAIEEETT